MKAGFLTGLQVETLTGDSTWQTLSPLRYSSGHMDRVIEVPAGFVTDFASVPRVPIVYLVFGDRAHHESVVHDYLYQTHLVSRIDADWVFLEAMKSRGKPLWIRQGMYLGVRLGGAGAYKSGPKRFKVLNANS